VVSLEVPLGAINAGKPIESSVMVLASSMGAEILESQQKAQKASGSRNPGNPVVSLELPWGARNAGKPIESPVMLLGAETLESQQKA